MKGKKYIEGEYVYEYLNLQADKEQQINIQEGYMASKKRIKRIRFKKRISEIIKIADKLTSVISILDGWDKWRGLF